MKLIFFTIFLAISLFSKEKIPSPISPAKQIYINLETKNCDDNCLMQLLENELFISFLTRFEPKNTHNKELIKVFYQLYNGIESQSDQKIAIIIPKNIKSYARIITDAIKSYILSRKESIEIKFIFSNNEKDISLAIGKARQNNINMFILPITLENANEIFTMLKENEIAYVPTLNKNLFSTPPQNVIFGGIDYKEQVKMLIKKIQSPVTIISDQSTLAQSINQIILQQNNIDVKWQKIIDITQLDEEQIKNLSKSTDNTSIFLNLPIIKAAFITNYLPRFEVKPKLFLSTQIGYDIQIFAYIDKEARQKMIIANMIKPLTFDLNNTNTILRTKIDQNWVAYSTVLGFEYLYSKFINGLNRYFKEEVNNNQVEYENMLFLPKDFNFTPIQIENR